ncbi:signal peptide peptidase SppA [Candidatus Poribacteria bacterium]|nr:signal peptide peptidase SppA [Candidatus Poribacteria bacterium]
MPKKLICFLYLCLLLPIFVVASPPKVNTFLPSNSVAMTDDSLATYFNPAGLGNNRALNLYYLRTYQSDQSGDDSLFISTPGGGFAMEFVTTPNEIDFTRYSASGAYHFGRGFYFGTNYSWINSDDRNYDKFKSLSVGLMYRRRYFSIGAIGRDLNRPKLYNYKFGRTYDLGVAFRPGTWRTTFSIDMQKTQGISGLDLSYGVEIRPIRELILRGTYYSNSTFDIRFGINLGNIGIGTANNFDENRNANDGVAYFHYSAAALTKPIRRKLKFIDIEMKRLEPVLRIAKWDSDVAGVLIRINGSNFGMGKLQELRDAIIDFKESGRYAICYITDCATGDYIVASVCDAIFMHPSAEIRLIGLRMESTYYKGTLDKLGIKANLEHVGEYKAASEAFTRKKMSESSRENKISILDDLYDQLFSDIAMGRGWTPQHAKDLIDKGPFTAKQAFNYKIVDELIYEDKIPKVAKDISGKDVKLVPINNYIKQGITSEVWEIPKPKIAIINAEGMMLTGESFTDPFTATMVMGADTIARAIQHTRKDDSIRAVVLRINSGGGLVIAADIIWYELMQLIEEKPLIVSMADVAASGGYYIAAPADTIVAEPGTITGSIGVIGGKYSLKGLYNKIGITKEILTRGAHADFYSDYSDYPPEEREIIKNQINEIYDDFITKVAMGRSQLSKKDVDQIGRGRVWTGRQAKDKGLVDQLGGLDLALSIAQKKAGLERTQVDIIRLPKQNIISQLIGNYRLLISRISFINEVFRTSVLQISEENSRQSIINLIRKHRTFLLMPYDFILTN